MADQYASLKPGNVVSTLRSLERRLAEALAQVPDKPPESFAYIVGSGGESVASLLSDAGRTLSLLDRALEQTFISEPVVHEGVVNAAARVWEGDALALAAGHELFIDTANTMADRADAASGDDWNRTATVTGGTSVTAMEIGQEAARTAITALIAIRDLVPEVAQ